MYLQYLHKLISHIKEMQARRRTSGANQAMFKIIMIGDSGTGKSCLLTRYTKDQFQADYKVTIGVQFASKKVDIDQNFKVKLQIWDTAGQESFRSIVKSFYRNAASVILVYNITNKRSFQSLKQWLEQARENAPKNTVYVLMGTHLDLEGERQVQKAEAESFMKAQNISMFFETSAKTAINVSKAFDEVAKQLFLNQLQKRKIPMQQSQLKPKQEIKLKQEPQPKKRECC